MSNTLPPELPVGQPKLISLAGGDYIPEMDSRNPLASSSTHPKLGGKKRKSDQAIDELRQALLELQTEVRSGRLAEVQQLPDQTRTKQIFIRTTMGEIVQEVHEIVYSTEEAVAVLVKLSKENFKPSCGVPLEISLNPQEDFMPMVLVARFPVNNGIYWLFLEIPRQDDNLDE